MLTLRPLLAIDHRDERVARVPEELIALRNARQPWTSYMAFSGDDSAVGACGFKAPPNQEGEVEIAYLTFPGFEQRGYGAAMAKSLCEVAARSMEVRRVIAHTVPEENPSVRICRQLGFVLLGEVQDPEDGRIWRWSLETGQPPGAQR